MLNLIAHCNICRDYRRFNITLSNAKRILNLLDKNTQSFKGDFSLSNKDHFELSKLYVKTNTHFMCGKCHKVNNQELWTIENKIKEQAYILSLLSKSEKLDKHQRSFIKSSSFNFLRGYYPNLAKLFC